MKPVEKIILKTKIMKKMIAYMLKMITSKTGLVK
jgi:hypothetical protein